MELHYWFKPSKAGKGNSYLTIDDKEVAKILAIITEGLDWPEDPILVI